MYGSIEERVLDLPASAQAGIGGKGGSVGLEWGPMGSGMTHTIRTHGDGPSPLVTFRNKKGKQERISEFFQQIKNPYCFVCNGMIVKMHFNGSEKTLEEKLDSYFLSL